jgi:hypothetical protein
MRTNIKYLITFIFSIYLVSPEDSYFKLPEEPLPQKKFIDFQKELDGKEEAYRNNLFEMGLNSNNILIFDKSAEALLEKRHFHALPIFEKLLQQEDLPANKRDLLFTNYQKLKFYSYEDKTEKLLLLKNILHEQSPVKLRELYLWTIEMFGEIADDKDAEIMRIIHQKHPGMEEHTNACLEKTKLNTIYPKKENATEKFIAATRNNSMKVRFWGLEHLSKINSPAAAEYLHLLYEQANFTMSKLEFMEIQKKSTEHRRKFPELYQNHKLSVKHLTDSP